MASMADMCGMVVGSGGCILQLFLLLSVGMNDIDSAQGGNQEKHTRCKMQNAVKQEERKGK